MISHLPLKATLLLHTVVKFVYSEKATKFCEISTLLLSTVRVHAGKSEVDVLQNFLAFSEYMNFTSLNAMHPVEADFAQGKFKNTSFF